MRAVAFVLGAGALVYFLRDHTMPLILSYMTNDAVAGQDVYVPGLRNVFDLSVGYFAAFALLVPALFALNRVTRGQDVYEKRLKKGGDGLKWLDLGISSALIIETICLVVGVSDPLAIKVSGLSLIITCGLGWLADQQNQVSKQPNWSAYGLSVLAGILPWIFVVGSLVHSYMYGGVRLPWFSYALAGGVFAGFGLVAINQFLSIRRYQQWKQPALVERNYLIVDGLTKLAFAVILIVGLKG